jgi:hypothetical protein
VTSAHSSSKLDGRHHTWFFVPCKSYKPPLSARRWWFGGYFCQAQLMLAFFEQLVVQTRV